MSKLKKLLPGLFGTNKDNKNISTKNEINNGHTSGNNKGRLETDASPVDENEEITNNNNNSTPASSTELTESVVHELSDTNYNSIEAASTNDNNLRGESDLNTYTGANSIVVPSNNIAVSSIASPAPGTSTTMNTMNVHNAQQQMVMQFSNINKLHFGAVYNINSNISAVASNNPRKISKSDAPTSPVSGTDNTKRQLPRKTTTVVTMMQSREEPSHRILETISTHLGEGWKHVMRELGHSEGQIEQALIDHQMHGGIKEVIYQLLLQWLRDADDGVATLGHITTLLWELNHRDCVQRMKLVYKSDGDGRKKST